MMNNIFFDKTGTELLILSLMHFKIRSPKDEQRACQASQGNFGNLLAWH